MKFGIVTFPGSNCDSDIFYVLQTMMQQNTVKLWHKDTDLQKCDCIVLPGGFSYGDYLRAGAIARFSPIMKNITAHAHKGKYVWGICNGFQMLTEAGLLPGALLGNKSQKFVCKNVYVKPATSSTVLTSQLDQQKAYKIPVANAEGRYFIAAAALKKMQDHEQILFQYCDAQGNVNEAANFNGSVHSIAGVTNRAKNIFGLMPHPERAADKALGNIAGKSLFASILSGIAV